MIRVEGAEDFLREVLFGSQATTRMRREVWLVVRAVSLETMRNVKIRMPVDTGAARARWGSPGAAGGVWRESERELSIEQGADLQPYEYIERLNEGYSKQAPAGFIDVEAERANDRLTDGSLNAVAGVWDT